MKSKAEKTQQAAYDAHVRAQTAFDAGDIPTAIAEDDASADLALLALFQRVKRVT